MAFDPVFLVYGVVFIGVLLLVEGAYYLILDLREGEGRQINRRLRLLAQGGDSRSVLVKLRRRGAQEGGVAARLLPSLDRLLEDAGITVPTGRVTLLMGLTFAILALGGFVLLRWPLWKALTPALLFSTALPVLVFYRLGRLRQERLAVQLPEAIDMIVRGLRAGHPVSSAISLVAREMPDPIGTEFGIVFDEMTYGLDLRDALENMSRRTRVDDLRYLVVSVRIQYGTGGNLAEVLGALATVIRERSRMKMRVRALSAEGRLSAWVLSLMPFGVAGAIVLLNPEYYINVKDDPWFPRLMLAGVGGTALGALVIRKLVNFRI